MKRGDPVVFRQNYRGGYDFARDVPAVFDRASGARVGIYVVPRGVPNLLKRIMVKPENVKPREGVEQVVDTLWLQHFAV